MTRMVQLAGLVLVLAVVIGALLSSGGRGVINALPYELALIGGASVGVLLIGNSWPVARGAIAGFGRAMRGPKWTRRDYLDALALLHGLTRRARKGGLVAIEADIEAPEASDAFRGAPRLLEDDDVRGLICDSFRLIALDLSNPARAEALMDHAIAQAVETRMRAVQALHTLADALPALGIVAAVIGIIRTMGHIDQSPAVLGAMIATALLGTFLGVFLAYGVVGPIASRYGQVVEEEAGLLETIRAVIAAHGQGASPRAAVEIGRATAAPDVQPTADELDQALSAERFRARPQRTAA